MAQNPSGKETGQESDIPQRLRRGGGGGRLRRPRSRIRHPAGELEGLALIGLFSTLTYQFNGQTRT